MKTYAGLAYVEPSDLETCVDEFLFKLMMELEVEIPLAKFKDICDGEEAELIVKQACLAALRELKDDRDEYRQAYSDLSWGDGGYQNGL